MENSTPLKTVKKKISKFLLIGNIFLMIFIVGLTGYYLRSRLLETQSSKACSGGSDQSGYCQGQIQRRDVYDNPDNINNPNNPINPVNPNNSGDSCQKGEAGCKAPGVGGYSGWHLSTCENGATDAYCTAPGGGGGEGDNSTNLVATAPTNTPVPTSTTMPTSTPANTPTPTPAGITNTPTMTPTGTIIPSNTPTVTPAISSTPTVTPLISNTPGPSATPTEIILAKISTSPTSVAKLLQTGVVKSFMYLIPAIIILVGLIL